MRHVVASALFFAAMAAFARLAGGRIPTQEIVFVRALVGAVLALLMAWRAGAPLRGGRPALLAARGVTGFLALSCYFWSVVHLPFAHAILVAQTAPLFTALFAWLFLGERPGARFVPAAALVLGGVVVLAPPGLGAAVEPLALGVALAGAILAGSAYAEVRALSRTEHPLTIVLWFQGLSAVLSVPGTLAAGIVVPRPLEWLWLAGVALTAHAGQVFLTLGLQRRPAGRATLANPLVIAFGAALAALVFDEPLGWNVAFGAGLLVAGLVLAGAKRAEKLPSA